MARLVTGVMLGILIARPFAGFIAEILPWRSVYLIAALLMTTMSAILIRMLPPRIPKAQDDYAELMRSMASILRRSAVLQSRTLYQAAMFGAFITFWTAIPLWLYGPPFNLSLGGIAWVAFAGAAGALSPPIATRLFDAGYGRTATVFAMVVVILAFIVTVVASTGSVALIVIAAVLLDGAVSANLVIGQRALYELEAELRGRMNALFMGIFFLSGALASASAGWIFAHYGWTGISCARDCFASMCTDVQLWSRYQRPHRMTHHNRR